MKLCICAENCHAFKYNYGFESALLHTQSHIGSNTRGLGYFYSLLRKWLCHTVPLIGNGSATLVHFKKMYQTDCNVEGQPLWATNACGIINEYIDMLM